MATIKNIADRLYTINGLIPNVNRLRYFSPFEDVTQLPSILALPRSAVHVMHDTDYRLTTRRFDLVLYLAVWGAGTGIQDVQDSADVLIDTILDHYAARPRLELDGVPLAGIYADTWIESDTAIFNPQTNMTEIRFTLTVQTLTQRGQQP